MTWQTYTTIFYRIVVWDDELVGYKSLKDFNADTEEEALKIFNKYVEDNNLPRFGARTRLRRTFTTETNQWVAVAIEPE